MTRAQRTTLLRYGITSALTLAVAIWYAASRDVLELEPVDRYHVLCDAFSLPGMFLLFSGALMLLNNFGALDTMSYFFYYLAHTFLPVAFGEGKSYVDYMEERRENRKGGFGFLFIVGAVATAIGVVFLILYMNA